MVHNGIEYGDMQLIAEAYHLLKGVLGLSNEEIANVFTEWNKGDLDSYLIEVSIILNILSSDLERRSGNFLRLMWFLIILFE